MTQHDDTTTAPTTALTAGEVLTAVLDYAAQEWTTESGGLSGRGEAVLAATIRILMHPHHEVAEQHDDPTTAPTAGERRAQIEAAVQRERLALDWFLHGAHYDTAPTTADQQSEPDPDSPAERWRRKRSLDRTAQAYRSLRLAQQKTGAERAEAFAAHFAEFAPAKSCSVRAPQAQPEAFAEGDGSTDPDDTAPTAADESGAR